MYREHVPTISAFMRESPDNFVRGCMFAILSIRQPVTIVPEQMSVLFDGAEATRETEPLFGHKWHAWRYLSDTETARNLWEDVRCRSYTQEGTCGALLAMLAVPGLGIVKAGFILQLMGFDVACLDTRNIKREGRNPRAYATNGRKHDKAGEPTARIRRLVIQYVRETYGKAEHYWNAWCTEVAGYYAMTPEEVSALHLSIVSDTFVPF